MGHSLVTTLLLIVYAAGIVVGLLATDARWPARLLLSALWPVGPVAFVIVVTGLTVVAAGLWPLRVLPLLAALAAFVYVLL